MDEITVAYYRLHVLAFSWELLLPHSSQVFFSQRSSSEAWNGVRAVGPIYHYDALMYGDGPSRSIYVVSVVFVASGMFYRSSHVCHCPNYSACSKLACSSAFVWSIMFGVDRLRSAHLNHCRGALSIFTCTLTALCNEKRRRRQRNVKSQRGMTEEGQKFARNIFKTMRNSAVPRVNYSNYLTECYHSMGM